VSLGDERQVKDSEVVIDTQDVQVQDHTTAGSEKKWNASRLGVLSSVPLVEGSHQRTASENARNMRAQDVRRKVKRKQVPGSGRGPVGVDTYT